MYTNAKATLYLFYKKDKTYKRHVLDVFWDETETVTRNKTGAEKVSSAFIMIPYTPDVVIEQNSKNRIIKGAVDFPVTDDSSYASMVKVCEPLLITSVDLKQSGCPSMHHWELGAK